MPTEARGNYYLPEAPYLRETETYLNYMHASRHSTVARVAQPATRVDTTCWQLFRPDINQLGPFLFVVVVEVMSNYLTG